MGIASIVRNLFGSVPFAVYLLTFAFSSLNLQIPSRILSITSIAASANPFLAMLMLGILFDLKLDLKKIGRLIYLLCLRLCINILMGSIFYFLLPIDRMMKNHAVGLSSVTDFRHVPCLCFKAWKLFSRARQS